MALWTVRVATHRFRTECAMSWLAAHVTDLAHANEGVVLTRHLVESGLSDREIRQVRRGLHRLCRGAYVMEVPRSPQERHRLVARATIQRYGTDVALSHVSAAITHGLPIWDADLRLVQLTGLTRHQVRRGFRHEIHSHIGPLIGEDLAEVAGVPVTGLVRTALDCARSLPLAQGVAVLDAVLNRGVTDARRLKERVASLGRQAGVHRARSAVRLADGAAESPGETRTRLILQSAGLPLLPQQEIRDEDDHFIARVDFLVEGANVIVEFDGRKKYGLDGNVEEAHWNEKERQMLLERAGYRVVRVVWADLSRPELLIEIVMTAIDPTLPFDRHRRSARFASPRL